jgi:hypothetical protein
MELPRISAPGMFENLKKLNKVDQDLVFRNTIKFAQFRIMLEYK